MKPKLLLKNSRGVSLAKLLEELTGERYEYSGELKQLNSDVVGKFEALDKANAAKKASLEAELEKQKKINDDLCKAFADSVKVFEDWITAKKAAVNDKDANLESLLALVNATASNSEIDGLLGQVDAAYSKVTARLITLNPYSNVTSEDTKAQWAQFQLLLSKKKELLETEIENAKRSGLTPEQLKEVNDNFEYFDKNKSGVLEKRELRSCLQSLGEGATTAHVTEILKQFGKEASGALTKEDFGAFMVKRLGDSNTKAEILEGFNYLSLEKESIPLELLDAVVNEFTFKQHHVEYLKENMKPADGGYDFKTWTEEVFAR